MTHLPEKDIGCHRTGFAKTCRQCVVEHNCQLWQPLRIQADRSNGQVFTEKWACADVHALTLGINMLGRQDTTSATVDKLAKTVAESNDQGMGGVLARINAQMQHEREARAQLTMELEPKMLEGAK